MAAEIPEQAPPDAAHLDCIHCGICLSACPTYLQLGMEADSPRGRIYLMNALKDGRVSASSADFQKHLLMCLECRACETACPSGVRFSKMMNGTRASIRKNRKWTLGLWFTRSIVMNQIFISKRLMHIGFRLLRFYQRSGVQMLVRRCGILKIFSGRLRHLESLLPEIPRSPQYTLPAPSAEAGKVLFFEGCIMPEIFGPVHEATVRVLQRHNIRVIMPPGQACCGALHLHDGDPATARKLARKNIRAFEIQKSALIIVNAAGCGASLKEYSELLADDPQYALRAREFSRRVRDISEYLNEIGLDKNMERLNLKVAYDDPCHLIHAQGIKASPRNLLRAIPGVQLVEMRDADRCCGSAGIYNITHPEMSARILDDKIADIIRSGAQVVATGNPGCLLQIQAGLRAKNQPIRVVHPIELLDQAYKKQDRTRAQP